MWFVTMYAITPRLAIIVGITTQRIAPRRPAEIASAVQPDATTRL